MDVLMILFLHMMGNRGKGNVDVAGDVADGRPVVLVLHGLRRAQPDIFKHRQTRFVGQRLERGGQAFHLFFRRLLFLHGIDLPFLNLDVSIFIKYSI